MGSYQTEPASRPRVFGVWSFTAILSASPWIFTFTVCYFVAIVGANLFFYLRRLQKQLLQEIPGSMDE